MCLALYQKGMDIEEVDTTFQKLSRVAFRGRNISRVNPFRLMKSYMHGQYPAEHIDSALREIFGDATSMFSSSYMSAIGARIGFPIVDVDNTKPTGRCLVTSYNAVGQFHNTSYRILQSDGPATDILVADA